MNETRYLEIISGRDRSLPAALLRGLLACGSPLYGAAIAARNLWFDHVSTASRRVDVPVIAIGNITTGGTGKTPMVAWIARQLQQQGRKVGVLTRGYRGRPVLFDAERPTDAQAAWRVESDEAEVLRRRCPGLQVVIEPDRHAGAIRAIGAGCNTLLLDDGFQHRRLRRDLDIVLVDATSPRGIGGLLPRGTLREPISALRRANAIVLTRADQIDEAQRATLIERLQSAAPRAAVLAARHAVTGFTDLRGRPIGLPDPSATAALVFAGIGNFDSFRRTVESLGITVVAPYQFPDHHDYSDAEIAELPLIARQLEANALLTTEKDAVKLAHRWKQPAPAVLVPVVEIEFMGADGSRLGQLLLHAVSA